ncbi:MAG TPA: NAD(P)/FAD-dependent oxidoreductase [Thermomicrobiales bacterium]|nr:NAD(P)/FAD-dependent oxidoreductase [Thermomicrobiales bacterium]
MPLQIAPSSPDVLIIGGGVAGSGLATVLARAGLDVTVVERAPKFIDRIRGEFVHAWGVREMGRVGLLDVAIDGAEGRILPRWTRYVDREPQEPHRWSDDFPDVPGTLSVSHPALQQALIEHAREAGARVLRPASLREVTWSSTQPVVAIDTTVETVTLTPRLLVGADGTHSAVRRQLGGEGKSDPPHHAIGGALLRGINLPEDSAHQAYFEGGFAMVFPQGHGLSRVYYVCSTEIADELQRANQPVTLASRLANTLPQGTVSDVTATGPIGFFPNSERLATVAHGPSSVLIGDAAGSNDPSQGHGLSLVFRDIRDLAERLHRNTDWSPIPAEFAAARAHDHGVLRAHAHWVAPLSTETGTHVEAMRDRIARAREIDPTAGGFAGIFGTGPADLIADDAARRHFLGEDIETG